jgi:hypothetical protein
MPRKSIEERFWDKINKTNSCWLWTGRPDDSGYGVIRYKGKKTKAHRLSWFLHFGHVPKNLHVLHKCDTPPCVRPDHLFLGTDLDNAQDRDKKKRRKPLQGELHGAAKLKSEDIIAIRQSTASAKDIARQFGIDRNYVYKIIKRKHWTHIP